MYDLLWDASTSQREHYIRMVTSPNYKVAPTLIVTVTYLGDRQVQISFKHSFDRHREAPTLLAPPIESSPEIRS